MAILLTPTQALDELRGTVKGEGLSAFCKKRKISIAYVSHVVRNSKPPGSKFFTRLGYEVMYRNTSGKTFKAVKSKTSKAKSK